MTNLTPEDIRKVATLAQLEISEQDIPAFSRHLSGILEYVEILNQVDTTDVEPLAHPIEIQNVFREDELTEMLPVQLALQNAPKTDGRHFVVPAILDATE